LTEVVTEVVTEVETEVEKGVLVIAVGLAVEEKN
jgi:hypothetical protein